MRSISFSEITTLVKCKARRGAGLERITKGMGTKMAIHVAEGMKRPENPLQAAKLASECGLIARKHMPVLPHFKEYKKDTNLVKDYIGKVSVSTFFIAECAFLFLFHLHMMITNLVIALFVVLVGQLHNGH